jgi:hypothetical protein
MQDGAKAPLVSRKQAKYPTATCERTSTVARIM